MPVSKKQNEEKAKAVKPSVKRASIGLSKSRYTTGIQCLKALYLKVHEPDLAPPISASTQRTFDQGHLVGEEARKRYLGGVLIDCEYYETDLALKLTQEAILKDPPSIFEGAFFFHSTLVRVDILKNNGDGTWDLIEVKSSTGLDDKHIPDMAIQLYVVEKSGLKIKNVILKHINRECVFPNLENLFGDAECTELVREELVTVPSRIDEMLSMLEQKTAPQAKIGVHCDSPNECEFKNECWKDIPEGSVFELNSVWDKTKFELYEKGIVLIKDIPEGQKVSRSKPQQIKAVKTGKPVIDQEGLKAFLGQLQYPLYFFDFETMNPAIPEFVGLHPYDQYPVQYSCHVVAKPGAEPAHFEYLADGVSDPRVEVAERLLKDLGTSGTILAYHQSFEVKRIEELASHLPQFSERLLALLPRFLDLKDAFTKYYCHPEFHGSFSIKDVLPVLVPSMTYEGMEVGDGTSSQVAYLKLKNPELTIVEKESARSALLLYCKQDTLAMVRLLSVISACAKSNCPPQ